MKYGCILAFLLALSFGAVAQTVSDQGCGFLNQLHYKNDKAFVTVKAKFDGYSRSNGNPVLKGLESQRKLRSKDYRYEISFYPENCQRRFSAVVNYHGLPNLSKLKGGTSLYLTIVVYRVAKYPGPYFLIDHLAVIRK